MKEIEKIPKTNPFKVPENYFEEVNRRILASTAGGEPEIKAARGRIVRMRTLTAVAASVILIVLLSLPVLIVQKNKNIHTALNSYVTEEIIETMILNVNINQLEEKVAEKWGKQAMPEIKKSEIIDYLVMQNINVLEIIEQL